MKYADYFIFHIGNLEWGIFLVTFQLYTRLIIIIIIIVGSRFEDNTLSWRIEKEVWSGVIRGVERNVDYWR